MLERNLVALNIQFMSDNRFVVESKHFAVRRISIQKSIFCFRMANGPFDDASPRQVLEALLRSTLPMDEVVYAFGYGSGVFSQQIRNETEEDETKLIDMIVVVRNDLEFHRANMVLNPSHYWVPPFIQDGAAWSTWWQRQQPPTWMGRNPGLYFVLTDKLKYGVVQIDDLCDDLQYWQYLYMAGRMQKPVLTLIDEIDCNSSRSTPSITKLQSEVNLPAALASSLLLLSDATQQSTSVTSGEVYRQIARLSYLGDFRVQYGAEDPQKITRLVEGPGQLERFDKLYAEAATAFQEQGILSINSANSENQPLDPCRSWSWDTSPAGKKFLYDQLPFSTTNLESHLARIVAPSARYQSFKGIITAGPYKAWKYATRKLAKGILRR